MPRDYRHIGQHEKEILLLKEKGLTHRKIAEKFGLNKDTSNGQSCVGHH